MADFSPQVPPMVPVTNIRYVILHLDYPVTHQDQLEGDLSSGVHNRYDKFRIELSAKLEKYKLSPILEPYLMSCDVGM